MTALFTEEKKEEFRNKVKKKEFEYEEKVRDFTGLIFHCPCCDTVFHLHIAEVKVEEKDDNGE